MNKIFSLVIVMLITYLELYGAYFAIQKGWNNESNFRLISEMYTSSNATEMTVKQKIENSLLPELEGQKFGCLTVNNREGSYKNMLISWLKNEGKDPSFNARAKLAANYNIKNYYGSEKQNLALLIAVRKEPICSNFQFDHVELRRGIGSTKLDIGGIGNTDFSVSTLAFKRN